MYRGAKALYKGGSSREGGQKVLPDARAGGFLLKLLEAFFGVSFWKCFLSVFFTFFTDFWIIFQCFFGYKIDAKRRSEICYFLTLFSLSEKQNCTTLRIGHQFAATVKNVVSICVLQCFFDIGLSATARKIVRAKLSQFQITDRNSLK